MSGENPEIARVEQDGRVLSGGTDPARLEETMERHAPELAKEAPPVAEAKPAAEPPVSRGRQRFSDLARERDAARAEAEAARAEREQLARERDELKARVERSPEPQKEPAKEQPKPAAAKRFPTFEEWKALPGNDAEERDWYTYDDEKDAWRYNTRTAEARAKEFEAAESKTIQGHVEAYKTKHAEFVKTHPDFDTVVGKARDVSAVMARAALEGGPELAYYLATHDEERAALDADTRAVDPANPAFSAVVATTRRHLMALIAAESRPAPAKNWTPPPAPHPTVGATTPTTAKTSAEAAKTGNMDDYRARRAAERGVRPRF